MEGGRGFAAPPSPRQGSSSSKWNLTMGPQACLTFPSPSALYHVLSRLLPAQLWPLPTGASGPSAPTPASYGMVGKEASGPCIPRHLSSLCCLTSNH